MLLLRAVVALVILILSVILSFGAALGVSALVFDNLFHFPGADPAVPSYAFVFLVALGVDYNIFLMSRVRRSRSVTAHAPASCADSSRPAASSPLPGSCWPRRSPHSG